MAICRRHRCVASVDKRFRIGEFLQKLEEKQIQYRLPRAYCDQRVIFPLVPSSILNIRQHPTGPLIRVIMLLTRLLGRARTASFKP